MSKHNSIQTIVPTPGYIVLEVLQNEISGDLSLAGIDDIPHFGKVIAVGGTAYHVSGVEVPCPVKVGDTVIHSGGGFETVKLGDTDFRVCPFDRILGVIK